MIPGSRALSEFEENVTCPVCLELFNDETKKPKYLVSCCHTVCRVCLNKICFSGTLKQVACPVCRRVTDCSTGIDSLPTNRDKLFLLKINREEKDDTINWCFTCGKKPTLTCPGKDHSVIAINPQLFNNEVQLNVKNLTSGLSRRTESIIAHRQEIAERLDQVTAWLDFHKALVDELKSKNAERISELRELMPGTNYTVSLQRLVELTLNNNELCESNRQKEHLEEETTLKILHELRQVERFAKSFGVGRNSVLLSLPTLECLRNGLSYESKLKNAADEWPLLLFEALNTNLSTPVNTPGLLSTKFDFGACFTPDMVQPNSEQSTCFNFPSRTTASSITTADFNPGSASSQNQTPQVFRFEAVPANVSSGATAVGSLGKGFFAARRRRKYFNSPLPAAGNKK